MDGARPPAGAHDRVYRLLRLRLHRGSSQRDRRRSDDHESGLDRRLPGAVGGGVWKTTQLLQQLDHLGRRRPTIPSSPRSRSTPSPSTRTTTTRSTRARATSTTAPSRWAARGSSSRPTAALTGRCSARTCSARRTPSRPASSRSTTPSARCASTRTRASKVIAGTKKGIFVSYNGGTDWTGPCSTNGFPTQRQDITGLELSDMGADDADRRRGRRARLRDDSPVRPREQRRERSLQREHASDERLPELHARSPRTRTASSTATRSRGARTRPARR